MVASKEALVFERLYWGAIMTGNAEQNESKVEPVNTVSSGAVFCSGCGKALVASSAFCPGCGTPRANSLPTAVAMAPIIGTAYYGAPIGRPLVKSKTTAVVLAVFLAFWTWLYSYKTDAWKFWVGLPVYVLGFILTPIGVGFFLTFGIHIWAIIDAAVKPAIYYDRYWEPKVPIAIYGN